jgi:Uma2 family endonuclease
MGLPSTVSTRLTYADYCRWPDDVRYELIDGVAYLMAPAPNVRHQALAGEIYFQLRQALAGSSCQPFMALLDVRLPHADEADDAVDTVVQPDVLVVCDKAKLDERGVRGAPDLVVEVLSPSTAAHDQVRKLAAYERAGVRECWLVHPTDRVLSVYRLEEATYARPAIQALEGETPVGVLPGVMIVWAEVTARLDALK